VDPGPARLHPYNFRDRFFKTKSCKSRLISIAILFIPLPLIGSTMDVLYNSGNKGGLRITMPETPLISYMILYTGRFIMFSVITFITSKPNDLP
jgi:hypothetical protein